MPRASACAITAFSALPLDGLMTIALAPAEIRLRMSAICSAGPPLRFATTTLLITPLAFAWALMAQIISSRQPLPTSVFETPSTHLAWAWSGFADAVTAPTIGHGDHGEDRHGPPDTELTHFHSLYSSSWGDVDRLERSWTA